MVPGEQSPPKLQQDKGADCGLQYKAGEELRAPDHQLHTRGESGQLTVPGCPHHS